jgi:hypothetical protein
MTKSSANQITGANSRPASPFEAGRQFGSASCAPPFLSAAVAQFWRSAAAARRPRDQTVQPSHRATPPQERADRSSSSDPEGVAGLLQRRNDSAA